MHFIFLLISLLSVPYLSGEPPVSPQANQAETLFFEKLYGDAIPIYSQLFSSAAEPISKSQWALRLASCHMETGQPETALRILSAIEAPSLKNHSLFLTAQAHKSMRNPLKALQALSQCFFPLSYLAHDLISLEKGCRYLELPDYSNAERSFKEIIYHPSNALIYELATLQRAKIALINHNFEDALTILSSLPQLTHSALHIEHIYYKGWAFLGLQNFDKAIDSFESLLPQALASQGEWPIQVIQGLIVSYLQQALLSDSTELLAHQELFVKIDNLFNRLLASYQAETSYLLLIDYYLIKAKSLSDPQAYAQARNLIENSTLITSREGIRQILFKKAAAAPSYQERSNLYQQLVEEIHEQSALSAKAWFLKGLNDFEEGLKQNKSGSNESLLFGKAAFAFDHAIEQNASFRDSSEQSLRQTAFTIKYSALAHAHIPNPTEALKAWQILSGIKNNQLFFIAFDHPAEIDCLSAWTALRSSDRDAMQQTVHAIQNNMAALKAHPYWNERLLKLEGILHLQLNQWKEAEEVFKKIIATEEFSSSHGDAMFWLAHCADQCSDENLKKQYFLECFTNHPQSPYAPIAYFHFYSLRDYMQGSRKALKHLTAMPVLFSSHPLSITAYYLIGLNEKKDRLAENGQIVKRKNWIGAIDAFQMAETTFDSLFEKNSIPQADHPYYILIRYQAQLERALGNLAIALQSSAGKRQIYLEYAEQTFKQLIGDFGKTDSLAMQTLINDSSPYPKVLAEAELHLAKTLDEKQSWKESEEVLDRSLERYRQTKIEQGVGLMRVWHAKGSLSQKQAKQEFALQCFLEAEKAAREASISPNEKLDLWIQQSSCYQSLGQLDQAMRLLSRVINEDAISPLRIKAMLLRSEIYEMQGRPELAIKQLEAAARKGGEWSQKAKEKLEKVYGY